jgi:hypothetical protein
MIHKLPYEIVAKIYGHLSIDEVTSVDITYREADYDTSHHGYSHLEHIKGINQQKTIFFKRLFEDRISMNLYLGQHFSDSQGLLKCMLINDIYISGSRALDYFVPGSTDENSDWDFYADGNKDKIFRFMEFMTSIGIKWFTTMEWFTRILEDHNSLSSITMKQMKNLLDITSQIQCDKVVDDAIRALHDEMINTHDGIYDEESEVVVRNSKGDNKRFILRSDIYSSFNIIYGTFNNHRKTQSVQLMADSSGIASIMEFYTSALQCGITGFCAFHMYAKDAYNRQSRLWIGPHEPTRKMRESRKKYEKRGYLFYQSSLSTMEFPYQSNVVFKRRLKDPDSHVIDFNINGPRIDEISKYNQSRLTEFADEKRRRLYEFSWIQNGRDLMLDGYHSTDVESAKKDAIQQFIQKVANSQPDPEKKRHMLSTLRDLSSFTGRFRAIANPIQTMLDSQQKMPDPYLDEFVNLNISG